MPGLTKIYRGPEREQVKGEDVFTGRPFELEKGGKMGKVRNRRHVRIVKTLILVMIVIMMADLFICEDSYGALKTTRQWGKEITDAKLNKYNGKGYNYKLPGVNQHMCTGYVEWALNSVYGVKVPGYSHTRDLRAYLLDKGVKIVAYGSHVAKAQGGNGKYYSYGTIKPGDIVFFFKRGTNKKGKVTKSPLKNSRGYTKTVGWKHVAIVGGSVSGSHGITSKLHHNTRSKGIHYSGSIKTSIALYSAEKGATDYQVFRVIEAPPVKRPVQIIKTMKVNGNVLPEEGAVFRIWPVSYGKYSSKASWWKKIPAEYKDQVTTDKDGKATTAALPSASGSFNGKYYIHQIKGPGIVSFAKNKQITLKSGTATVKWTYTDSSTEHPEIIKKDAVTGDAVTQQGITFRLKKKGAFRNLCVVLGTAAAYDEEGSEEMPPENAETEEQGGEKTPPEAAEAAEQDKSEMQTEAAEASDQDSGTAPSSGESAGSSGDESAAPIEASGQDGGTAPSSDESAGSSETDSAGSSEVDSAVASEDDSAGSEEDEDNEENEQSGIKSKYGFDDADKIVKAFLSDDPESALKELGVTVESAGWVTIGGKSEFTTDESGVAEITAIGEGEPGEYEVYETKAPEDYKLPGYSVAAADPDSASDLDKPVDMELESLASTTTVEAHDMPEPEIGTNAVDDTTENHVGSTVENAGITDTVSFDNLEKDKRYTVFGTLMFKDSGEPVKDSKGEAVTGNASFTAEEMTGSVEVGFAFDGRLAGGRDVVVFERLYEGDLTDEPDAAEPLARHEDINDEDQTVSFPEPPDEPEEPDEPDEPDEPEKAKKKKIPGRPKTGDDQMELVLLLITVLIAAIVILTIMMVTYRDKSKDKTESRITKKGMG